MNKYAPIEQIIAKLDNDFNLDNSDWIPRIATWAIEAMSQLKVLKTERKRRKLIVNNRIVKSACNLEIVGLKVYDSRGCEIEELSEKTGSGCSNAPSSTGELPKEISGVGGFDGIGVSEQYANDITPYDAVSVHVNEYPPKDSRVVNQFVATPHKRCDKNYVIVDCHTIELNFDADEIYIESDEVATMYSDYFKAEVPVIPNNGLLIEAIGYYCLYKIMCRGIKHPVFNFSQNGGTNPWYMWINLKEQAKRSVTNDSVDTSKAGNEWRSFFYNYTFPER